jgi:D-alanyl-D-alanine carboxypeptidase (penicillin-binding protein 5/6)
MNKVARECGMKNTRFANAHGLSNQFNKSTAEDMAKLATIAMKNQLFAKICNTQNYKCSVTDKK